MRIVLINPSYFTPEQAKRHWEENKEIICSGNMYYYPFEPPVGLASILSSLRNCGHEACIIDMQGDMLSMDEMLKKCNDFSPDIVGITAMTTTIRIALGIADSVKELLPDVPVILGGVHPTVSPESVLKNNSVDYAVRGEGEEVLCRFANQKFSHPEEIEGLCWKNGEGLINLSRKAPLIADLDALPRPDYSSFPVHKYIDYTENLRGIRGITMMVTRGCPYNCSFCAVKETMGKRWRRLDPVNAVHWMMDICKEYDLEGIWFKDSTFNMNKKWTQTFAESLLAKKSPYRFQINTRVDLIRENEIVLLKQAGLVQVDLGIESGSQRSLDTLRKKITAGQIKESVKILKKHAIKVSGFFMIGIPGETEEDILLTLSLAKSLELDRGSVSIYTPLPGSELYERLSSEGKVKDDPASFEYHHFTEARESFCEVPIERLKKFHAEINTCFS